MGQLKKQKSSASQTGCYLLLLSILMGVGSCLMTRNYDQSFHNPESEVYIPKCLYIALVCVLPRTVRKNMQLAFILDKHCYQSLSKKME